MRGAGRTTLYHQTPCSVPGPWLGVNGPSPPLCTPFLHPQHSLLLPCSSQALWDTAGKRSRDDHRLCCDASPSLGREIMGSPSSAPPSLPCPIPLPLGSADPTAHLYPLALLSPGGRGEGEQSAGPGLQG